MRTKFQNELAERAYEISLDGMEERSVGSVDELGWYGLVVVDGRCVIVTADSLGFVDVDDEESHHSVDHARIMRRWDEIERWYTEFDAS